MRSLPLVLAALAASSCAYQSAYVAPADGRARVIWRGGEAVALMPSASAQCELALRDALDHPKPPPAVSDCASDARCGAPPPSWTYVHGHGPVFLDVGVPHFHHGPPPVPLPQGGPVPTPVGGTHQARPAPPVPSGGLPSLGSGGGSGAGELAIVLAVLAILTLPVVAIALISADPETGSLAAGATDQVNAFNDLARSPTACAPAVAPVYPTPEGTP